MTRKTSLVFVLVGTTALLLSARLFFVCTALGKRLEFASFDAIENAVQSRLQQEVASLRPDLVSAPGLSGKNILRGYFSSLENCAIVEYRQNYDNHHDVYIVTIYRSIDRDLERIGPSRFTFSKDFRYIMYEEYLPKTIF